MTLGSKIAGYNWTTGHLGSRSRWEHGLSHNGLQSLFVNHINISKSYTAEYPDFLFGKLVQSQ